MCVMPDLHDAGRATPMSQSVLASQVGDTLVHYELRHPTSPLLSLTYTLVCWQVGHHLELKVRISTMPTVTTKV